MAYGKRETIRTAGTARMNVSPAGGDAGACVASEPGRCGRAETAMGFGARGVRVDESGAIAPAIEEGFASGRPTLIEVPLAVLGPAECRP